MVEVVLPGRWSPPSRGGNAESYLNELWQVAFETGVDLANLGVGVLPRTAPKGSTGAEGQGLSAWLPFGLDGLPNERWRTRSTGVLSGAGVTL